MKVFSMFSGIGGFENGLINALGKDKVEVVGYSEIDKYAIQIYDYHFKGERNYGNCTKINWGEVPEFDILVGGFPCQSFSIAGKRLGFEDTRGTLFFEIARCLKERRPRHFLLENVKGLLSHDSGSTFKTIITTLTELGYCVEWQVCNSKNFGVPQNRERVFFVGHLGGECARQIFPIREGIGIPSAENGGERGEGARLRGEISSTIDTGYNNLRNAGETYVGTLRTHKDGQGFRGMSDNIAPTIPARAREDGSGQGVIWKDYRVRRLTPVECERLQGFPDDWTRYGIKDGAVTEVSDTQRYKTLGNAVTTTVVEYIARIMAKQKCL